MCFDKGQELVSLNKIDQKYQNKRRTNNTTGTQYCKYHGTCNHNSEKCRILKDIKKNGFDIIKKSSKINNIETVDSEDTSETNINKDNNLSYSRLKHNVPSIFIHKTKNKNPFYITVLIDNKPVSVLLDTGADVSLMSYDKIEEKQMNNLLQDNLIIQTATGEKIETRGYIPNLKFSYKHKNYYIKTYIVNNKNFQTIFGADFLKNNLKLLGNDTDNFIKTKELKKLHNLTTEHQENIIFEKYSGGLGSQPPSGDSWATLD
ncbi:hypothetical protein BDAP_001704 [Binucleata daphniae]